MDKANAATERTRATQPRISLAAVWRRLTSISVKNQSPVSRFQPDQCAAKSSSDMTFNCFFVNVGLEDMDVNIEALITMKSSLSVNLSDGKIR